MVATERDLFIVRVLLRRRRRRRAVVRAGLLEETLLEPVDAALDDDDHLREGRQLVGRRRPGGRDMARTLDGEQEKTELVRKLVGERVALLDFPVQQLHRTPASVEIDDGRPRLGDECDVQMGHLPRPVPCGPPVRTA